MSHIVSRLSFWKTSSLEKVNQPIISIRQVAFSTNKKQYLIQLAIWYNFSVE